MSRYDIRGMQASGMTNQQINDYIKQQDAKFYGPRGGSGPKVPPKPSTPLPAPKVPPKPTMGVVGRPLGSSPAINQNELQKAQMQATQRSGFSSTPAMGGVGKPLKPQVMPTAQPQSVPQSVRGKTGSQSAMMKKGGEAKKYTKGGKINLDACGVSTAQKSKSSPKW